MHADAPDGRAAGGRAAGGRAAGGRAAGGRAAGGRAAVDRVALVAHAGLGALAVVAAVRYVDRHGVNDRTWLVLALSATVVAADAGLSRLRRPTRASQLWLGVVCALWIVLVAVAPSFVWCAFPLLFLGLRILPGWAAMVGAGMIASVSIAGLLRLSGRTDPSAVAGPLVVSALIVVTHRALTRETEAHARVIGDLTSTRGLLAEQERAAGTLAERQRLASEVHDTVAQGLASVLLLTQAAEREITDDPAAAKDHLARAVVQARHDLDEVRRIVHALAPPALVGASLASALEQLCERHDAMTAATVTFTGDDHPSATTTTQDATLFRIAQEAITNAVRHAGASRIDVTVCYLPDRVTLDVVDDGQGFDARCVGRARRGGVTPAGGFGLSSMRARAEAIGGNLTVETAPGAGTAVAAMIPIRGLRP